MTTGAHQGVIYCNGHGGGSNGWSFPRPIERRLQRELAGLSVLHLFGGRSKFGTRLDIDASTDPDVLGDAWMPPFAKNSFDCVILDPPYVQFGRHVRQNLGMIAAWIARSRVVWFSSFASTSFPKCSIEKWWTVIVGNDCYVRQLAYFRPLATKLDPMKVHITRGPAIRYNRWKHQPQGLPFGELPTQPQ